MTEAEWLGCVRATPMPYQVDDAASGRKLILFAAACAAAA
jgi:hypothetical protein